MSKKSKESKPKNEASELADSELESVNAGAIVSGQTKPVRHDTAKAAGTLEKPKATKFASNGSGNPTV